MSRVLIASCGLLFLTIPGNAADPKPLWEIDAGGGEKASAPAWISYSPDGRSVVAVVAKQLSMDPQEFSYKLRVWDAATQKERFAAVDLGRGKTPAWGDDLASFPSDNTVLTGGHTLVVRNLETGSHVSSRPTGGNADHTVWAVPDLRETFHLRREPDRDGKPVELFYSSTNTNGHIDEFGGGFRGGRGFRNGGDQYGTRQTEVRPPRTGMRPQGLTLNPGRTRLVAAFRDDVSVLGKPRHSLAMYRIKTVEEFDLDLVAEATNPHASPISALAFAKDGKTLATGGEDGSVCLWDMVSAGDSWKPRATITGAYHRVVAMSFRPDWRIVAAITWDKSKPNLLLIDADTGTLVRAMKLDRELTAVAWSQNGRTLLTGHGSGKVQAWDADALLKGE